MLKFVSTAKAMPDKRSAAARVADFDEIYGDFNASDAETQAARCSQCGVPFCQVNCPLHNNIPDWLMLTAEGRMQEAYELSSQTNNFPEICGRICPQDRLCEGSCVIEKGFQSVTIGAVEKHITETAFAEGWVKPAAPRIERAESVAIIGAGPAGLAAAEMLRHQGYQVHVYDRYDRVGGLLIYGIPGFKLEKSVVERRGKLLADGGVQFHLGQPDATGRQVPEVIEGSSHEMPADMVIKALGFDPEDLPKMFGHDGLDVTRWGTLKIDWDTMMTSEDGVFAAGDIVRGASLVVWGVRDGRDAARAIDNWINAAVAAPKTAGASR
jgi:NADPH-dependent glutamate synthase beta subunit-like oxidoreductase